MTTKKKAAKARGTATSRALDRICGRLSAIESRLAETSQARAAETNQLFYSALRKITHDPTVAFPAMDQRLKALEAAVTGCLNRLASATEAETESRRQRAIEGHESTATAIDALRGAVARLADRCADDGTAGGMTVVGFANKARNDTIKALDEIRGLVRLVARRDDE